ncbi:unnamed protein product [marine sediment metagenome]|uniref:Uncharacterized protein n=1 Tax=marine sediment metagenome TaxID=412755 RepID=X0RS38_9ZZZZ
MKLFRDVGGTYDPATGVSTYGSGWNYNNGAITQANMASRVLGGRPGRRTARIRSTTVNPFTGNKQFYFKPVALSSLGFDGPNSGGLAQLDPNWDFAALGPQIIYTYSGPQKYTTSPWYYVRTSGTTTSMDEIQKVWAMYTYDGWVGSKWRLENRKDWESWAQVWLRSSATPTPINQTNITFGCTTQIRAHSTPCINDGAHDAQVNKPTNAGQFQYSII